MKKRILSLLLVLVMAISGLTACGGTGANATANFDVPEGGYDGSEVTITFYHTMGANLREVLELYIAEFNKLYPNIHIVHEQVGGYDDVREQIATQITTGAQPNIAYCYPDHVAMYNISKAVVTLDNLIKSEETVTRADGTTETLGLTEAQISDFIAGYYHTRNQALNPDIRTERPYPIVTVQQYLEKAVAANAIQLKLSIEEVVTDIRMLVIGNAFEWSLRNGKVDMKENIRRSISHYLDGVFL